MAGGMKAQNDFCAWGMFDAQTLSADGDATVRTHFERRADTPNVRPPRAARGWAQDGPFLFPGEIPGLLRGLVQLAMGFVDIAMES